MLEAARICRVPRDTHAHPRWGSRPGACSRAKGRNSFERRTSLLAFDGRVDAYLGSAMRFEEPGPPGRRVDALIEARGVDGLDDLAADFALARLDWRRSMLTLARDGFGLRPLFWARRGRRFGFASDPRVLVELDLASGEAGPRDVPHAGRLSADLRGSDGIRRHLPRAGWAVDDRRTLRASRPGAGGSAQRGSMKWRVTSEAFAARFRECLLAGVRSRARTGAHSAVAIRGERLWERRSCAR